MIIKYPNHNIKKLKITLAKAQQYALQHMLILTLYMHIQNEFILYVREVYRVSCNKGQYFLQILYYCSSPTLWASTPKVIFVLFLRHLHAQCLRSIGQNVFDGQKGKRTECRFVYTSLLIMFYQPMLLLSIYTAWPPKLSSCLRL